MYKLSLEDQEISICENMPEMDHLERFEFHEPQIQGQNIVILGGWHTYVLNYVERTL